MLACVTAFEGLVSGRRIGTLIGTCGSAPPRWRCRRHRVPPDRAHDAVPLR